MQQKKFTDSFGNPLDPIVGFARGRIIQSSVDEARRLRQGQKVAAERVRKLGPQSIGVFTGNQREFPLKVEDLNTHCEEWVGPGLFAEELRQAAIAHMGGLPTDGVATVNRTSAGIIATIVALAEGQSVVSVVPPGGRSHASVIRGCGIARVELHEVQGDKDWAAAIEQHKPALVVITTVTSSLEFLDDAVAMDAAGVAKASGAKVLLDEAYGARMRPVLRSGVLSLKLGGDLAITNCDKAGLSGPRSGLLVGRPELVTRVSAKASEFGMEARAPIAASALRSIQRFSPQDLIDEAQAGQKLAHAMRERLGAELVAVSDLGPMIEEDLALKEVFRRAGRSTDNAGVTPAEVTSALGMVLLRDHGILTVNTHGQPGARVSVRLKPTHGAIERVGGMARVIEAMDTSFSEVARYVAKPEGLAQLILGDTK
ncbi:aminotransferase class I/II-fold pyridoxal phosphate-dependent enzyme [Variovorax ginsengisoli]|uniref:Aminotransferase class I/II-fold pyridoxal phosphate-dependent enzyme n=1 Tax=Variovorax ginsengisoli TaxID=363844 RepID=A0ABT8SFG0_9BURK|nr:aminotransferase class I/II-fold pyridoxal phosphate-dependent enzyme [Variovorax ginsengisoli]MDN8618438.1 aminotransferase class I/II-fold pyridoxal phosphate-dependent enzyme [Variovorax ginsengisoli]MDO1537608.1 aminotransferase class I/II-fold pyridoxal phosphate-dependent enzyme [Variovorax ginsengisoli]